MTKTKQKRKIHVSLELTVMMLINVNTSMIPNETNYVNILQRLNFSM